jgi:5-hydroxyisourate hydrolase/2-oxo-4-hydroxy-4-carboxy-5-ureidoimidazoline decarboxylase
LNIQFLNAQSSAQLFIDLEKCCGSSEWIKKVIAARPYKDIEGLYQTSDNIWASLAEDDYLEAFTHHPQIGDIESMKKKFASTASWAENEQKGSNQASIAVLSALKIANQEYLAKFGFIFIVCATGKTAQQMLDLLNQRMPNKRKTEIQLAALEQNKITHLRIDKLLSNKSAENNGDTMSPITTHILDTAKGCPAANIAVTLEYFTNNNWDIIAQGTSDADGRIMNWMEGSLQKGQYRICFITAAYHNNKGFFPSVTINFTIDNPDQHYHVPLLLSPYSYSTYRGS